MCTHNMKIDFNRYPFDIFADTNIKQYLTSYNIDQGLENIGSSTIGRLIYGNPYVTLSANTFGTIVTMGIQQDFNEFMRAYADYMQHSPSCIREELKGVLFVIANMIQEEREKTTSINYITDGPRLIWNIARTFSIRDGMKLLEEEWEEKSRQWAKVLLIAALSIVLHCKRSMMPSTDESQWVDDAVTVLLSTLKYELTLDGLCKHEISHIMPYYKGNIYNNYRCRDVLYQITKQRHPKGSCILNTIDKYGYAVLDGSFV